MWSAEFILFILINIATLVSDTGGDTQEKWECTSHLKFRGDDNKVRKQIIGEKKLGSAIHLAVLMHCILMGFLQVALCSTPFPQWEHFLPATELGCANSGDIQVSGPEPYQDPRWEGPAQYKADSEMNSLKEKKKVFCIT